MSRFLDLKHRLSQTSPIIIVFITFHPGNTGAQIKFSKKSWSVTSPQYLSVNLLRSRWACCGPDYVCWKVTLHYRHMWVEQLLYSYVQAVIATGTHAGAVYSVLPPLRNSVVTQHVNCSRITGTSLTGWPKHNHGRLTRGETQIISRIYNNIG